MYIPPNNPLNISIKILAEEGWYNLARGTGVGDGRWGNGGVGAGGSLIKRSTTKT